MLSDAIALEATFSVIGLGIPPPTPSLGNMVAEYKDYILAAPWLAAIPVVVVALTIASLNTLAKELTREFSIVIEVA
jgi:peptide/nickel transport system permease protein